MNVNFKEKMAQNKEKFNEKKAANKAKFDEKKAVNKAKFDEKKENLKNKAKENNPFVRENRQRMSEEFSHNAIVSRLHNAYKSGNVKAIDKIIANIPTSDMVESIWREAVYEHGGRAAAERISNTIIEGADYVGNMNKYQTMINPYNKYNLALWIADGNDISADYVIDDLAEDINICADKMGYEEIFHFEETDEDGNVVVLKDQDDQPIPTIKRDPEKILMNTAKETVEDIDKLDVDDERKNKIKATETKRADEVRRRHANDTVYVFPTDEEIEAERQAYLNKMDAKQPKKAENKKTEEKKPEEKSSNTNAGNETIKPDEVAKPEKKTIAKSKKTNLKEVIDPFEIISETIETVNEIASSVEENAKKEDAKSTPKSTGRKKTGGTAPAKKSKSAGTTA